MNVSFARLQDQAPNPVPNDQDGWIHRLDMKKNRLAATILSETSLMVMIE